MGHSWCGREGLIFDTPLRACPKPNPTIRTLSLPSGAPPNPPNPPTLRTLRTSSFSLARIGRHWPVFGLYWPSVALNCARVTLFPLIDPPHPSSSLIVPHHPSSSLIVPHHLSSSLIVPHSPSPSLIVPHSPLISLIGTAPHRMLCLSGRGRFMQSRNLS